MHDPKYIYLWNLKQDRSNIIVFIDVFFYVLLSDAVQQVHFYLGPSWIADEWEYEAEHQHQEEQWGKGLAGQLWTSMQSFRKDM